MQDQGIIKHEYLVSSPTKSQIQHKPVDMKFIQLENNPVQIGQHVQ